MGKNILKAFLQALTRIGIRCLVTLAGLMKSTAVKEGEYYKIKDDLFEMIMGNVVSAEKALQTFGDISKIGSGLHEPERVSIMNLYDIISERIKLLNSQISLRNHHVVVCDKNDFFNDLFIEINTDYFIKAFEEIL